MGVGESKGTARTESARAHMHTHTHTHINIHTHTRIHTHEQGAARMERRGSWEGAVGGPEGGRGANRRHSKRAYHGGPTVAIHAGISSARVVHVVIEFEHRDGGTGRFVAAGVGVTASRVRRRAAQAVVDGRNVRVKWPAVIGRERERTAEVLRYPGRRLPALLRAGDLEALLVFVARHRLVV